MLAHNFETWVHSFHVHQSSNDQWIARVVRQGMDKQPDIMAMR